jgi:tRNA-dihydrouridine synthase B
MAGVADDVFRQLCAEQGAALVYTEMVSAKAISYGDRKSLSLLAHTPTEAPIAYQLFAPDPETMIKAITRIEQIEEFGGKSISCALYDINMGCPVPKVVKNGEGSALMRDPDTAARIVEAAVSATDKPVTVKTRSGWDAAAAKSGAAIDFAKAMEQAGAAAIAIHGRTREQYYSGKADWEVIARVKQAVNIPVIGSGDVTSARAARDMLTQTKCNHVMIARAAQGNPWIFQNHPVSVRDRSEMFIRHARMLEADKGEYVAVREMRKHAGWYFKGLPGVSAFRASVNKSDSLHELTRLVTEAFNPKPE